MSFVDLINKKIKKLTFIDMTLTKIAVMAFTLLVAKIWSPVLSLDWYWYALIWILAAVIPISIMFKK